MTRFCAVNETGDRGPFPALANLRAACRDSKRHKRR